MGNDPNPNPRGGVAATVGWGLFCTASWTWCIGMFFPLLLLRDYGWPGLVAFLVPNAVGCAAFGYVLDRDAATRLRERHAPATVAFSAITLAYQLFFLAAIFGATVSAPSAVPPAWIAGGSAMALALVLSGLPDRWWPWLGTAAVAFSLSLWVRLDAGALLRLPAGGERPLVDLLATMPMLAFGFLLCPYLDLTFHRALDRSPSRHAFGVFGVAFLVTILAGALYFLPDGLRIPAVLGAFAVQLTFTSAAHVREIRLARVPFGRARRQATLLVPAIAGIGLGGAVGGLGLPFEKLYLLFLGCYGTVLPAYVWLLVAGRSNAPSRGTLLAFAATAAIATPPAVAAVLGGPRWLLAASVGILLVARFAFPVARRA